MGTSGMLIALLILVAMSGIFSATETAFSTFNRVRVKTLAGDGNRRAALVMDLVEDYDSLLSTILIGNNIVNIAMASLATVMFVQWFPTNGAAISTAVTTVFVLIFGEISPKSIAKELPDGFVMTIAPVIRVICIVFTPLNLLFRLWKKLLAKIFKFKGTAAITEDELITIVDEATQDGGLNEQEGELIRSAIEFNDVEVGDIITPRVDVVAIDDDTPFEEIGELFMESGFSRLPVYRETIDDIFGVLHEKDYYRLRREGSTRIEDALGKPFFVPCHVKISKLLEQFRQAQTHMAIVLDDYGGTMGVATLEDVIEELVGDIWDEHDEVIEQIREEADGALIVSGDTRPQDMFERLELSVSEDELPQTVSGWVTKELGEFPEKGAHFVFDEIEIDILSVDEKLVDEIRVRKCARPEEENDTPAMKGSEKA